MDIVRRGRFLRVADDRDIAARRFEARRYIVKVGPEQARRVNAAAYQSQALPDDRAVGIPDVESDAGRNFK